MKRTILLAIIALAALSARAQVITTDGIDKLTLGSTKEQIEQLIGKKIALKEDTEGGYYDYETNEINYKGDVFTAQFVEGEDGITLLKIATSSPKYYTKEGAKVGSKLSDLKKYYGDNLRGYEEFSEMFVTDDSGYHIIYFYLDENKVVDEIKVAFEV